MPQFGHHKKGDQTEVLANQKGCNMQGEEEGHRQTQEFQAYTDHEEITT